MLCCVFVCACVRTVCSVGQALMHVLNENLKDEAGARESIPHFVLLLTDGKSQDDAVAAASKLKNVGVEIIAVGETSSGTFCTMCILAGIIARLSCTICSWLKVIFTVFSQYFFK